jgi:Na+-translocating ferredoxin:NAD+ oxidoreductase RnfG subunit
VASVWLLIGSPAWATTLITVDEALNLAFPDGIIERETVFLTDEQRQTAEKKGGSEVSSSIVTRYAATGDDEVVLGWAYLDTHRVRTLPETLMIVLHPDGTVRKVEVVTFREPLEYMPRESWYQQYQGQELNDDLALKRDIRPVTGATLTARATTEAVRRVLAVHETITASGAGP